MQKSEDLQNQQVVETQQLPSMNRSRLTRNLEKRSRMNLFFSLIGIIILLFVLIKFGIPILANFSAFISGSKNPQEQDNSEIRSFIPPPTLNSLPQATSSATIVISGFSQDEQDVELYINDDLKNKTTAKKDGIFSFTETLLDGENTIMARVVVDDKKSEFSKPIVITFRNKPPSLNIDSPIDGQIFSKDQNTIDVIGTTNTDVKITINGFRAIVDGSGRFLYRLSLQNGENTIKIVGEDEAGNKVEKEVRVTYNP